MNRRQFLTFTIAMAAAAPIAFLPSIERTLGVPVPAAPLAGWTPSQAEVDEWLTYYKLAVRQGVERFADVVLGVPTVIEGETGPYEILVAEQGLFEEAERAFLALESDRRRVARSQGAGYAAGREGAPRCNAAYSAASHEAFGWYNGWATGNFDYRLRRGEVTLPRSPGVTWPKQVTG